MTPKRLAIWRVGCWRKATSCEHRLIALPAAGRRTDIDKPDAPACERNREPILALLRKHFADRQRVLEIGSGTGQHAVFFAEAMPWLTWQCSDREENLAGILMWLQDAALPSMPPPLVLDVNDDWTRALDPACTGHKAGERAGFDAVFSANTLHIMGWPEVEAFFAGLESVLARNASVVVYGPFNDGGNYTSDSNRDFDGWLRARDPASGIRDFEAVDALARGIGLCLVEDVAMPANNRCLVWRRGEGGSGRRQAWPRSACSREDPTF